MVFQAIRGALCGALCLAAAISAGAELDLVSIEEIKPGKVVARVQYSGTGPLQATDMKLQLDAAQIVPAGEVAPVAQARPSMAVLICIDRSGSMGPQAVAEVKAALRQSLAPRDASSHLPFSVAIVAFATRSDHLLGFTSSPAEIAAAVGRLAVDKERHGRTKLHDTLAGGLAELRATDAASKRLLVVSDGQDEGSDVSQAKLIDLAQADPSITVNAVGFGDLAASSSGPLAALAGATNGRFTIAASQATLASAIMQMIRQAVEAPQYDVTFNYEPDKGQRRVEAIVLLYRPQAGQEAKIAANVSVVAVVMSNNPPAENEPGWMERLVHSIPLLGWIGAGILILVALLILLFRSRKPRQPLPSPPPQIGPTKISPGPTLHPVVTAGTVSAPIIRGTLVAFRWPIPGDGRVVAMLTSREGAAQGRQFPMTQAKLRIGAALDNDLVLQGDDFISSHHVILKAEANALYVVDLGSRNGTGLNGSIFKDTTRPLLPGDEITLGHTLLQVTTADGPSQHGHPSYEPRVP